MQSGAPGTVLSKWDIYKQDSKSMATTAKETFVA